jgi:hypothetical protein
MSEMDSSEKQVLGDLEWLEQQRKKALANVPHGTPVLPDHPAKRYERILKECRNVEGLREKLREAMGMLRATADALRKHGPDQKNRNPH